MRWIKASERLPDSNDYVYIRYNMPHTIRGYKPVSYIVDFLMDSYSDMEWLEESDDWIPVTDENKHLLIESTNHMLLLITNNITNHTYWEVLTGYADADGDLWYADDSEIGCDINDVHYYKPIGELPPLP